MSSHYVRCVKRFDEALEWRMVSYWSVVPVGSRLSSEYSRTSYTTDPAKAKRWAKKYGVPCPLEAEPPRIPTHLLPRRVS